MPPSISVNAARLQDAAEAIRARGPLTIRLYTTPPSELPSTEATGGIVEATFPGYAGVVLVEVAAPAWDGAANAVVWRFNLVEFINTGSSVGQTVYGYYVTDSGGEWVWGQAFPTPIVVNDPDDGAVVVPVFKAFNLHP